MPRLSYDERLKRKNEKVLSRLISTEIPVNPAFHDKSGTETPGWRIIKYAGKDHYNVSYYWCQCKHCGRMKVVSQCALLNPASTSCGCVHIEKCRKAWTIHGGCYHIFPDGSRKFTHLYNTWQGMNERCRPSYEKYAEKSKDYYSKGIRVCKEWNSKNPEGFSNFRKWAYENGYHDPFLEPEWDGENRLTIDRIDNSEWYSPENCRWIPKNLQSYNQTSNRLLTWGYFTFPMAIWQDILGLPPGTFLRIINEGPTDDLGLSRAITESFHYKGDFNKYHVIVIPDKWMQFNRYDQIHKVK